MRGGKYNYRPMYYLNPITLLSHFLPHTGGAWSAQHLKQAQKVILAEFELRGTVTVEVAGREWDKDSILKVLEEFADEKRRIHYQKIMEFPSLEDFLSHGTLTFFQDKNAQMLFQDPAFSAFVMPYFAPQYQKKLLTALQALKYISVKALCDFSHLYF